MKTKFILILILVILGVALGSCITHEDRVVKVVQHSTNGEIQSFDIKPETHDRYFLICYNYYSDYGLIGTGDISWVGFSFPNKTDIQKRVCKTNSSKSSNVNKIIITSIFEFKSEDDYNQWYAK